jgi:hypothetical protein
MKITLRNDKGEDLELIFTQTGKSLVISDKNGEMVGELIAARAEGDNKEKYGDFLSFHISPEMKKNGHEIDKNIVLIPN